MVQAATKVLLTFFQVFRGEISQSLGLKVPKRHEAKMKQEVANREDPMNHIASHYNNQLVFAEYFKSCITVVKMTFVCDIWLIRGHFLLKITSETGFKRRI